METLGTCGHMGAMHGIAMACVSAPCFSCYQYGNSRPVFCHAQPPCFKLGSQILASRCRCQSDRWLITAQMREQTRNSKMTDNLIFAARARQHTSAFSRHRHVYVEFSKSQVKRLLNTWASKFLPSCAYQVLYPLRFSPTLLAIVWNLLRILCRFILLTS